MLDKTYLVYKQEFKHKVSFRVLTKSSFTGNTYILNGEKYIASILAKSLEDAAKRLKEKLTSAAMDLIPVPRTN